MEYGRFLKYGARHQEIGDLNPVHLQILTPWHAFPTRSHLEIRPPQPVARSELEVGQRAVGVLLICLIICEIEALL